jgi:hypothetical protein
VTNRSTADFAALEELVEFRATVRAIVRRAQTASDVTPTLLFLLRRARGSAWPEAAVRVLVDEVCLPLDLAELEDAVEVWTPWERAQRRLRHQGYACCPTCRTPLATELELERRAAIVRAGRAELASREAAVHA